MAEIPAGNKYAVLALPLRHLRLRISDSVSLGNDLYATKALPFPLPDHWKGWLGTLRTEELNGADFFIVTHAPSRTPEVLDQENEDLIERIRRLYFGFLVAGPYVGHDSGMLMTGTRFESEIDVRRVQHYEQVFSPPGCHGAHLDDAVLHEAKRIADGVAHLEGVGEHSRVWRITHAFYAAVHANEFGIRLHECVRCIEGFVLPEIGKTKKQMLNRTRLFLGSGHEDLVGTLFDIRSAVEHLHGPYGVVSGADESDKTLNLAELSYKSEAVARYCLQRLFANSDLWPYFRDDDSFRKFWALDSGDRAKLWGAALDTAAAFGNFRRHSAALQLDLN